LNDTLLQSLQRAISAPLIPGAHLFPDPALDCAWDKRCEDLARAVDRLSSINSQNGLILLRSSFSVHLLRCSPSVSHPSLAKFDAFDALLIRTIQHITNSDLSDSQWIQASLPVRNGGLR